MGYFSERLRTGGSEVVLGCNFFYPVWLVVLSLSICLTKVDAIKTKIWEQKSVEAFQAGTAKSVSVSSAGEIVLHRKLETVFEKGDEVFIWCLAEDSAGNIYAGTGNGGKIYHITPEGESSLFYDSPEVSILCMAIDSENRVYVGTAPSGLVYRVDDDKTPPTTLLSTEESYVWSLAFDPQGNLYAATGTEGKIYKIPTADDPAEGTESEPSVLFDADETNIVSLIFHHGYLYAGSDGKGTIFKISLDGDASVVYQTGQKEVHSLVGAPDGSVFAGTVTTAPPKPGSRPSGPPTPDGRPPEQKKSRIYQVQPNGTIRGIWNSPEPLILSINAYADYLIVGTGDDGKIYHVTLDGESVAIAKCEAKQVLALNQTTIDGENASNLTWVATGNQGKVFQLSESYVEEGTLESEAYDAKSTSRWGKLSWRSTGGEVTFSTRSGNTGKPDNTWSDWSGALANSDGAQITSPEARFLQWKAVLKANDGTPTLQQVRFGSVQLNLEPRIGQIQVHVGVPKDRENRNGPPQRSKNDANAQKKRTAKWEVADPNDDPLEFTLYSKRIEDNEWQLLKEELKDPVYTWDATAMPDGEYHLKLVVSDQLGNQQGTGLAAEKISSPFEVDNTQPVIADIQGTKNDDGSYRISCVIEDGGSPIKEAVYKIDSDEEWKVVFPSDLIFDSRREELVLTTEPLERKGRHTIAIRVVDTAGNIAVGGAAF